MKLMTLVILVGFGGLAIAQDSPRYQTYMKCLAGKVPDFDDGISDAATVGRSMHSACLVEFNAMINDMSKSMTIGELKSLDARAAEIRTEYTTRAVLMARVAQRKLQAPTRANEQN